MVNILTEEQKAHLMLLKFNGDLDKTIEYLVSIVKPPDPEEWFSVLKDDNDKWIFFCEICKEKMISIENFGDGKSNIGFKEHILWHLEQAFNKGYI